MNEEAVDKLKKEIPTYTPAFDYKPEVENISLSKARLDIMIQRKWGRINCKITNEILEQNKNKDWMPLLARFKNKTFDGIIVRCPRCGKVQITHTIKTKKCAFCQHGFAIYTESGSRIVWIPLGKRSLLFDIYDLTFHGKYMRR